MNEMPTIAYHTLGCKVNQYETDKMRESLEKAGFTTVPFSMSAQAYLINTCSVTSVADSKSRAAVRKALRLNPDALVVVAGCYAALEPAQIQSIEGVEMVVAHEDKETIPERIAAHFGVSDTRRHDMYTRPRIRTRAVVKVQDGCDQFCAYCVIPYARVGKKSRRLNNVIDELEALADYGYKEIVLAGIRLGSYEDADSRLPQLISYAARIDGIERIRLSSIEPWEINDHLLEVMSHPKVCRHLHIPLQSGDSAVLSRMNRPYDAKEYYRIIERVRNTIDDIGITTDVIVGFPGETDREFANTCVMVEKIDFSRLHVFRYSPRPKTKAVDMPGQIDALTKKVRAEQLAEIGKCAMTRFASSHIGKNLEVLVETASQILDSGTKHDGNARRQLTGFAGNYISVAFPGDPTLRGKIVKVKIVDVDTCGGAVGSLLF